MCVYIYIVYELLSNFIVFAWFPKTGYRFWGGPIAIHGIPWFCKKRQERGTEEERKEREKEKGKEKENYWEEEKGKERKRKRKGRGKEKERKWKGKGKGKGK